MSSFEEPEWETPRIVEEPTPKRHPSSGSWKADLAQIKRSVEFKERAAPSSSSDAGGEIKRSEALKDLIHKLLVTYGNDPELLESVKGLEKIIGEGETTSRGTKQISKPKLKGKPKKSGKAPRIEIPAMQHSTDDLSMSDFPVLPPLKAPSAPSGPSSGSSVRTILIVLLLVGAGLAAAWFAGIF